MQPRGMPLWKKMWLLFTVIWVIVAGLNAMTIIVFSEGAEQEKAYLPIALAALVPAVLYGLGLLWQRLKKK
jgi:hypothetical protein